MSDAKRDTIAVIAVTTIRNAPILPIVRHRLPRLGAAFYDSTIENGKLLLNLPHRC
jgi:hypothetical protein